MYSNNIVSFTNLCSDANKWSIGFEDILSFSVYS